MQFKAPKLDLGRDRPRKKLVRRVKAPRRCRQIDQCGFIQYLAAIKQIGDVE